jgi:hypothetical protein
MKPVRPWTIVLFVTHALLLALAATRFTMVTAFISNDHAWTLNYYQYTSQNGWGYLYESPYTGAQVATYLAAYGLGLVVFINAFRRGATIIGGVGALLCSLGVVSFIIEGSHWFTTHNRSWVASFPGVVVVLWIFLVVQWIGAARSKSVI